MMNRVRRIVPVKLYRQWVRVKKSLRKFRFSGGFVVWRRLAYSVGILVAIGLVVWLPTVSRAAPRTVSLTSDDYFGGSSLYDDIKISDDGQSLSLQSGLVGAWGTETSTGLSSLPTMVDGITNLVAGPNNTLYYMTNFGHQCHLERYSIATKQWTALYTPPAACGAGNSLVFDGNKSFYYVPGGASSNPSSKFYRYDISSDSWHRLEDFPSNISSFSSAAFVKRGASSYVYIFRGYSSPSFWRYSIDDNTFTELSYPGAGSISDGIAVTWDGANNLYTVANRNGEAKRYDLGTGTWTSLTSGPSWGAVRATLTFINGSVYAMRLNISSDRADVMTYNPTTQTWAAYSTPTVSANAYDYPLPIAYDGTRYAYTIIGAEIRPELYRMDLTNSEWNSGSLLTGTLDTTQYHQSLMFDGNSSVYYFGGTGSGSIDRIYEFDTVSGVGTRIGSQSFTNTGNNGAYSGGLLYVMPTSGTLFQSYDKDTNTFTRLADMPYSRSNGADILDGGDGYLYATFGGNNRFYRYEVATDTWTALSSMPHNISSGGNIARVGRAIYVLAGDSSGYFMRYNMDSGAWSSLDNTPNGSINYGGFLITDTSRYLYAGTSSRIDATAQKVYRYDTTNDTWLRIADLPSAAKPYAGGFYDANTATLYVAQGSAGAAVWKWNTISDSYVADGVWQSRTIDMDQVQSWQSLDATVAGAGSVTFYTRTSSDDVIWSDWEQVSSGTISSPVNRYVQIKAELSGDGTQTPTVSDVSITYNQETAAPSVPSQFTARGESGGEVLSSGQTYEYQHPYFTWSGASDGTNGSGVDGYYVYFGLNSSADPVVDGSYQEAVNYTVSTPMTAGEVYYMRIRVKDGLGNISPTATYFSYRYFYISPPNSIIKTSDSDFSAGTNTNVDISNGAMQLVQSDTGAWSTGTLSMLPDVASGGAMAVVGDYVYVARGSGSSTFWRYSIPNQTWTTLNAAPSTVNVGSSLVYDDDAEKLYLIAGNSSTGFYEYDIINDTWSDVGVTLPYGAQQGTDMTYIGGGKIAIMFTGSTLFYMFNSNDNKFTPLAQYLTTTSMSGSGVWYDGNDAIYAYFGGWNWNSERNSRVVMAKYTISTDSWKALTPPSVTAMYTENNLVSDGQGNLYITTSNRYDNLDARARMLKYSIASDEWSEVNGLEAQPVEGTMASDGQRYIYIIPDGSGTNSRNFIRYDSWTGNFSPDMPSIDVMDRVPYDSPTNAWTWYGGNSSTATYDGSKYIYALTSDESTSSWSQFVQFDPETSETNYLPQPSLTGIGGALAYMDGYVYYLPGKNTRYFYRFSFSTEQWVRMADTPGNVYRPGSTNLLAIGGSLYAAAGNNSRFYKFTPNASTGTWTTLADSPSRTLDGSLAFDDDTNSIFVLSGDTSSRFYQYSITSNTWSTKADLPAASTYGSAMSIVGGKIYASPGTWLSSMYVYDIAANSWSMGASSPEPLRYGSSFLKINDSYAYVFAGEDSPDVWRFIYPEEDTAYDGLAIHVSEPMQIAGLYDYAGIQVQATIPDGSRVEMWTRTSDDGTNWDDWSIASDIKQSDTSIKGIVTSTPRQYTQIKLVMESDTNFYSPTIDSYTLSYYFDVDPPQNPSVINVYSNQTKATALANNTWYNHASPLLDWPDPGEAGGATDGPIGSNIAGYWVYFGTDPTASPRTQGVFVSGSEYTPTLTSSGTYYLRIQTQDATKNVDGNIYAPFIYKFDNQAPTNPSLVTVTPSGFTTQNNYSYVWPNAFDAHSGVAGYCYHTGATSGPFAADVCQSGTSLTDVSTAYRSGTNVFYVRAYDVAGNIASSYTTVSYYYSTDPPGPVTNLRAIPPTSSSNMFAFTWDLPAVYSGDPNQMSYCYSINVLPSALNTTCTSERFIAAFKAATQEGTNIIYVIAKDEAGNANWTSFAATNFIANTISPGIPLNLVVSDTSDRVTSRWSMTLTWDKPTFEGNGISSYVVERSEDGRDFSVIGNTSTRGFVDLEVTPNVLYYYRVRAQDDVNNTGGASAIVAKSAKGNFASPPSIIVPVRVVADFDQAKITWVTDRASSSFVYYGTSPDSLDQSKGSLDPVSNHSQVINGLSPSTTYYYRVQSFDDNRNYNLSDSYSEIFNFKTSAAASIDGVTVSDITSSSAVITWQTSVPTRARISYGPTQSYGLSLDESSTSYSTTHTVKLDDLLSGTLYHFKIVSTTEFGSSFDSDDYTFQTIARPVISNIRFQPITDETLAGVRVTWQTNVPTTSVVKYSSYGNVLESSASELVTEHSVEIRSLASNSEYQFTLSGRDEYGNLATSAIQTWQSNVDTRPPDITETSYSINVTSSGDGTKSQMIVSWTTDEPATSQVKYGSIDSTSLNQSTPIDTEPTTSHIVIISGLDLSSVYAVQIESRDLDGNTALESKTAVVTPDQEESVFDKILNLMVGLFRF